MDTVDAFGMGCLFLVVNALFQAMLFACGAGASAMLIASIGLAIWTGFLFTRECIKSAKKYPLPKSDGGEK